MLSNAAAFSSVIVTGHELWDFAQWTSRFLVLRGGVIATTVDTAGIEADVLVERVQNALHGRDQ